MSKKDILEHYLESKHVDIALICETWLKDNNIRFKHYNILTCNRIDGYGGVAIKIRKNIAYHNITQVDYMPIKLKLISLYVNPNMKNADLKLTFPQILEDNIHEKFVIIGGDINCHNELSENYSSNDRKGNYFSKINPNTISKNIWNKINKLRQVHSENHGFFDNPVSITNFLEYNFPNREIKSPVVRKTRGSPRNIFTAFNLNKIITKKKSKSPGIDGISS